MKLKWDEIGERLYETGIRNGVLYPRSNTGTYPLGVAWNGLTSVSESPSGAEPTKLFADDIAYVTLMSVEELGGTIEAYMHPDEFAECDGTKEIAPGVYIGQQPRKYFGLAYRTVIGNDVEGEAYGYKLHLVYGALAAPSERAYNSINDSPEANTLSWEFTTSPVNVSGAKPTALLIIDSTTVDAEKLKLLEAQLFGADAVEGDTPTEAIVPHLLLPDEVAAIFAEG